MLKKLFSILVLIMIFKGGANIFEEQLNFIIDFTQIMATQSEVKGISDYIYLDMVSSDNFQLPKRTDNEWCEYIRSSMCSKTESRDTCKDFWLTPFRVRNVKKLGAKKQEGYEVRSAGPDKGYETEDDIIALR